MPQIRHALIPVNKQCWYVVIARNISWNIEKYQQFLFGGYVTLFAIAPSKKLISYEWSHVKCFSNYTHDNP